MKIGVYGLPCAGKDTFNYKFIRQFNFFIAIKGSSNLDVIAMEKYSKYFKDLDDGKQAKIRRHFARCTLKSTDNLIIDGHFCFPKEDGYLTVLTDNDVKLYDIFIYLKVDPKTLHSRIAESEKNKLYQKLSIEDIKKWQNKEIEDLRDIAFNNHKEFLVLGQEYSESYKFLDLYLYYHTYFNAMEIAKRYIEEIKKLNCKNRKIAILDCDRTVSVEDTTISYFDLNRGNKSKLKDIFDGDIYTVYQFYKQQDLYKKFKIIPAHTDYEYNDLVLKQIDKLKKYNYTVVGLTSGIYEIWKNINEQNNFFTALLGNDLNGEEIGIVSDFVKGYICELLKKQGYKVTAIGDSMCDIYMLEESKGFIFAPGKVRPIVQNYFNHHKKTKIKQFLDNPYQYDGIKGVRV